MKKEYSFHTNLNCGSRGQLLELNPGHRLRGIGILSFDLLKTGLNDPLPLGSRTRVGSFSQALQCLVTQHIRFNLIECDPFPTISRDDPCLACQPTSAYGIPT